jgi:molybdate transport system substrate-binding protein
MKRKFLTPLKTLSIIAPILLAVSIIGQGKPVQAEEIRLLSAAVMQTVFKEVVGEFERASGHKLIISYATMGAINQRVLDGETADLVVGSTASMAGLVKAGRIAESQVTIAKVGVGIVVPTGTAIPRVTSVDEFKQALLAAKTVVYADPAGGGAAGIHIGRVIEKLGIAEQLRPKTKFGAGGDVTEVALAQGEGTLGMTQISEIVGKPGAEFVGPLPDELQNYTGVTIGTPTGFKQTEAATALVKFLSSPAAVTAISAKGMQVN